MLELFEQSDENKNALSILKDPFSSKNIEQIFFVIRRNWEQQIKYTATVYFKNGNTKGEQNIETSDFPSLLKSVEEFVKSLDNEKK